MRKILFLTLVISALLAVFAGTGLAQEPDYDRVNEIAKKLNCPTCSGLNLADCRTLTCQQWRDQISDLVKQGYSDQEVLDYFTTRFGSQVLQEPPRSGWTLVLWVLPVIALLAGGVWLVYAIRNWTRREAGSRPEPAAPQVTTPISDAANIPTDYLRQVDKDLED